MRFLLSLFGASLHAAGLIQGIALENLTGLPLARTRVTLERLEGDRLRPITTVVAGRDGGFMFQSVDEGYYRISGARPGFAKGTPQPFLLARDGKHFVELRLKRLGLVTGRALDENRVGLPRIPVHAYLGTDNKRIVASAIADDLGVYRLSGLPAGKYRIRTGAAQLDDSFLPTYHPFASVALRDAIPVQVDLDGETRDIDIQPVQGRLGSLTVNVNNCVGPVRVALSGDTGRRIQPAVCNLEPAVFTTLAPGDYEILAETEQDSLQQPPRKLAAFTSLYISGGGRQAPSLTLALQPLPELQVRIADGPAAILNQGIVVRRREPAGEKSQEIPITSTTLVKLLPGIWQITARPQSSYYLSDIRIPEPLRRFRNSNNSPDWFEFSLDTNQLGQQPAQVGIELSAQQAQLSGRVQIESSKPAIGAPVYLYPTTPLARRRVNGVRTVQTDASGQYHFTGLAPGSYLVVSSYTLEEEITDESMAAVNAVLVTLEEGRTTTQDLALLK